MNLRLMPDLVIVTEYLVSFCLLYILFSYVGYIVTKLWNIQIKSYLYGICGFMISVITFTFVYVILNSLNISFRSISICYSIIMITLSTLLTIYLYRQKKIKLLIPQKEELLFTIVLIFVQIIVLYITIEPVSFEKSSVLISGLEKLSNGDFFNISGLNIINGIFLADGNVRAYPFDLFISSIAWVMHISPWIVYHMTMSVMKLTFFSVIIISVAELIYENDKTKKYVFISLSIITNLIFYYGGVEISPTYRGVLGETLYAMTIDSDVVIRTIMIPLLFYGLLYFDKARINVSDKEEKKSSLRMLILIAIASSCVKYSGAFVSLIIISAYFLVVFLEEIRKNSEVNNIKEYILSWLKISIIPLLIVIVVLTKFKITYFLYFKDLYKELWRYNKVDIVLTLMVLLYLLISIGFSKKKEASDSLVYRTIVLPTLLVIVFLMNPIITKFTGKFLGFADMQNKIWWCVPYGIIIVYGLIKIYEKYKDCIIFDLSLLVFLLFQVFMGDNWGVHLRIDQFNLVEATEDVTRNTISFIDRDVVEIIDFIYEYDSRDSIKENEEDVINLFVTYSLSYTIQAYDSNICMPYADRCYSIHQNYSRGEAMDMIATGELTALEVAGAYYTDLTFEDIRQNLIDSEIDYAVLVQLDMYTSDEDNYYHDEYIEEIGRIAGYSIVKISHN